MWKAVIAVIIVALIGAGGYLYYQSTRTSTPVTETSTTPTPEEIATPTPQEVDRAQYSIEVQNGSGIVGKAGEVQQYLEDAGFTVSGTANADSYDYEATVIYASSDVDPSWVEELRNVIGEEYDVEGTVEELDMDTDADVVVIVGQNNADGESMSPEEEEETDVTPTEKPEATNTPTPSPTVSE
ncbi:LytR C-terminal domain-containing protein [Candidatus Roizmanbacteria bacterium]|nr:MAG: LytR C-terminal domain-containing protein [Candidatus Roizmanbacteria bacterium]